MPARLGWVVKVSFLSETSKGQRLMVGLNYLLDTKEKRWPIYWLNGLYVNYYESLTFAILPFEFIERSQC